MKPVALILLLIALTACARQNRTFMPLLEPDGDPAIPRSCEALFPRGTWQFSHLIEFVPGSGRSGSTVIGVTAIDDNQLNTALMTVEGLTLFEARETAGGKLEVRRAVAPFDAPPFAPGMMHDVHLIFSPPAAGKAVYGRLADNTPVCRYTGPDGYRTDILPAVNGCWQINSYNTDDTLNRSLAGSSCHEKDGVPIPGNLELKAFGPQSYTLKMTLIEADNLNRNTAQ